MGGYKISYETIETFVGNQARMAKAATDKADELKKRVFFGDGGEADAHHKYLLYSEEARVRRDVIEELAKYIPISEAEINKLWEAGTQ